MTSSFSDKRVFGLDIVRAAAILFVMQSHGLAIIAPHLPPNTLHVYWLFILDGVDLFFVLSGFLIGGILIKAIETSGFDWKQLLQFWMRRWMRTLPNYFLVLIVLLCGYYMFFGSGPDKLLQYAIFTQSFNDPHPHFFPEAWSLAVEEWFYLIVPAGMWLALKCYKKKREVILSTILTVIVAITVFRIFKIVTNDYLADGTWDANIRKQVLTRLDSIMYGVLGAYLSFYHSAAWLRRRSLLFIAGLFILFGSRVFGSNSPFYYQFFYIPVQALGMLLLLPKFESIKKGKGIVASALRQVSLISYSMYLLNYTMVLKIILPRVNGFLNLDPVTGGGHALISYAIFWTATIVLSYLLYRFFERPILRMRDRKRDIGRSRSTGVVFNSPVFPEPGNHAPKERALTEE